MKFGCCVSMSPSTGDPAGICNLETVARSGYDYVELPLAEIMLLEDADFDALLERLHALSLNCESCNNLFPKQLRLTGPDRDMDQIRAYLVRALSRASRLGAQSIVFGSAVAKNVPEGFPMDEAWTQIDEELLLISDVLYGVDAGICVAIEPVCKRESNILLTYAEAAAAARRAQRSNIRCLVDFYHMQVEGEALSALLRDGDLLQHVHISNPNGRGYPAPGDGADYAAFLATLREAGYDRRVSIEAFTRDMAGDSLRALAYLRGCAE